MRTVCLFSGQGSAFLNQGLDLFHANSCFSRYLLQADAWMQSRWQRSLIKGLYEADKGPILNDPLFSHPALFALQYAAFMSYQEELSVDLVVGVSLGEWVAMTAAGIWNFQEAFVHMMEQAELFHKYLEPGCMIAVLESKQRIDEQLSGLRSCYAYALETTSKHFTLSVLKKDARLVLECLEAGDLLHQLLPVAYPFHSPWIEAVRSEFVRAVRRFKVSAPRLLFGSCTGIVSTHLLGEEHLWAILRDPIYLSVALTDVLREDDLIIDCSPGGVMKGIIRLLFGNQAPLFSQAKVVLSPYLKRNAAQAHLLNPMRESRLV